jgi:hypothetical protein
MGNRHLYKIEYLHTVGTPESERLKVTALPSPKRLPAAQGFGRRGYAQAGLNLFHPTASPLFQNVGFFHIATQPPGKGIDSKEAFREIL